MPPPEPNDAKTAVDDRHTARLRNHFGGEWVRDAGRENLFSSGTAVPYDNDPFAARDLPRIIGSATDLSSTSPELEELADVWPASYYLSPRRTSVVRGFDWPTDRPVLEVGAGCGTITRYLGETFDEVVAVEGHPDRANVASLRTRDLGNVTVATSDIDRLEVRRPFGVVFCIGVLEYSPTFTDDPEPAHRFLSRLRSLVTDDGWLVLAIENKFGLKYLRGVPEDHTARPFEGIHGYPRKDTANTWSRAQLDGLFAGAGFETRHFSYPLPDYKFPEIVLSDAAARSPHAAALSAFTARRKPAGSTPDPLTSHSFDEAAVTAQAATSGILPEVANSFLVFASPGTDRPRDQIQSWDAIRYTYNHRRAELRSMWQVDAIDSESPQVHRRLVTPRNEPPSFPVTGRSRLVSRGVHREACLPHTTIATGIWAAVDVSRRPLDTLVDELRPWIDHLGEIEHDGAIDGDLFDAVPSNLIRTDDGTCVIIDREYLLTEPVSTPIVVVRGLVATLRDCPKSRVYPGITGERTWPLIRSIAGRLGVKLQLGDLVASCRFEADLQRAVTGVESSWSTLMRELLTGRVSVEMRVISVRDLRRLGPKNLAIEVTGRVMGRLR